MKKIIFSFLTVILVVTLIASVAVSQYLYDEYLSAGVTDTDVVGTMGSSSQSRTDIDCTNCTGTFDVWLEVDGPDYVYHSEDTATHSYWYDTGNYTNADLTAKHENTNLNSSAARVIFDWPY